MSSSFYKFDSAMKLLRVLIGVLISCLSSCGGDSLEDLLTDCSETSINIDEILTSSSSCASLGSIDISVSGGASPYEYSLTGSQFQSSKLFNVSAGNYVVYIRDAKGCSINTTTTVNAEPGSIEIISVSTTPGDCGAANGSITIDAAGGTGSLSYQLDGGTIQSNSTFTSVKTGQHTVKVLDGFDCMAERFLWIPSGVSLSDVIMPIILANCANSSNCHSTGAPRVDLSNPLNVISKSLLIKDRTQDGSMPPRSKPRLSQGDKDLIKCWVDDGALNN